jgi:hypothetical protein
MINKYQQKLDMSACELSCVVELLETINNFDENQQDVLRVMRMQLQRSTERLDDILRSLDDSEEL